MPIIEVEKLCREFAGNRALDELSFSVEPGEIFGLVGPDGSGKTTCLRILCGLIEPSSGKVSVLGTDVSRHPERIRHEIGYMAQPAGLYDDLTVAENIQFYAALYDIQPPDYKERMERLLHFSGLAPFSDRYFRNLSGGMKQKAGLSCALIHTPRILFLDEPTNGVDPVSRRDFWKILYELKRENVTIVVASTYLDEADRCHRVAMFEKGKARLILQPMAMRSLMKGFLFNLSAADRIKTIKALRRIPQVKQSSVFGAEIHILLSTPEDLPAVQKHLTDLGITDFETNAIEPTLEDVYLSLVAPHKDEV
ncbi:ATP-binding cassette domain-containing protein [Desulfosarcina sp.]|uniref:ABC transporter ATP-binding protein n=1 Tax=Desulfosarcina sp. TaxID=2027861 RepID=UPI003970A1C8